LLRRDRSSENRAFERSRRGDILVVPRSCTGGDIPAGTPVEVIRT